MNTEKVEVGMVSSFHPHSMCKKVERVTAKTGCTSCTKWTISFEVSGFRTKTHPLQKAFHFLNNLSITKLNIMIKHTNIKHKKRITEKSIFKVKLFTN